MERLIQIYEMQKELDEATFKKFNLNDKESVKNKKVLGFIVEVAELANATKSFKYWSRSLPKTRDEILDEYSDGLHYILSLCLDLNISMTEEFEKVKPIEDLSNLFLDLIKLGVNLKETFNNEKVKEVLSYYIYLGERLGFQMGDILAAYIQKSKMIQEKNDFYN
jgi:dimeric dUTPase (all-alpha-NTP-PPase superfamily)